jgi:hypothetical protein
VGLLVHNMCAQNTDNRAWDNIINGGNLKTASKKDLKGINEHDFKKEILGDTSTEVSKFNISIDKDTKQIYFTPVKKGSDVNIPTDYKIGPNGPERM